MKVCQKCGTKNEDVAVCCTGCGNNLNAPASSLGDNVVNQVKKMGRSPVFIMAVVAVCLTALISLWSLVLVIINYVGGNYYFDGYMFAGDIITYSISFLFIMLVALGMVLFMSSCISKKSPVSTAGLTIIKTIQIIELVFTIIGLVLILLLAIAVLVLPNVIGIDNIMSYITMYGGYYGLGDYSLMDGSFTAIFNIIMVVVIIFTIAIGVLVIIYYIKTLKTIKSVKSALKTGQPNNKASMYIVVMNFIIVALTFLGLIGNVFTYLAGNIGLYDFILTEVSSLLSLIALLCIAIGIIMFRSKMNGLMNGSTPYVGQPSAPYIQPVAQAAPTTPVTPSNSVFCTKCGAKIEGGSAFCTSCGQKV